MDAGVFTCFSQATVYGRAETGNKCFVVVPSSGASLGDLAGFPRVSLLRKTDVGSVATKPQRGRPVPRQATKLELGFEGEGVLAGGRLGGIGERGNDGDAFVPIAELVGVVAAAELAALAARNEHEGIVPVTGIGDETHSRAVMTRGGARAEGGAALWLAGVAEKSLEPAFAAKRMKHFERIETLPGPVFHFG